MSVFRGALEFFYDVGIYDVVLPFLLIFTIVFAMFEKSRIFGTYDHEGKKYTKKNLDAMVAFVTAFFVVGSTQLVAVISQTISNVVLLLVVIVCFLLLAGSFQEDKPFYLEHGWRTAFMWIAFIGVLLIFLHALGWLGFLYGYITLYWNSVTIGSIILLILIVLVMVYITREPGHKAKKEEK
ncbi:hypothetical protein ACFL1B_03950 [Nanoarchaeota archaeon]